MCECGLLFSQNIVLCPPFHVKEALHGFSLACLSYQHHYFCALGPSLSKIRVTCPQALRCCDSRSDDHDGYYVTGGAHIQQERQTKG